MTVSIEARRGRTHVWHCAVGVSVVPQSARVNIAVKSMQRRTIVASLALLPLVREVAPGDCARDQIRSGAIRRTGLLGLDRDSDGREHKGGDGGRDGHC